MQASVALLLLALLWNTLACAQNPVVAMDGMQLAQLSPKDRRVLGDKGRAFVMAHHTYPVLAQRFVDAVRPR